MNQFRKELHRYRWLVLIAILMGLTLRWWSQRDQAERLMDMPGSYDWQIYQGHLYWLSSGSRNPNLVLYSMPVTGGERHTYGEDPGSWHAAGIIGLNEAGIYYTAEEEPQGYRRAAPRPKSAFLPLSTVGHPPSQASQTKRRGGFMAQKPVYLHYLAFSGEPVQEITSVAAVSHLYAALAGNTIYWTCSHPTRTQIANHVTLIDQSEITFQPVKGGQADQISSQQALFTALYAGSKGVYGARQPDPANSHLELVYMQAGQGETSVLSQYDSWDPPIEWNSRVYWTKTYSSEGKPQSVQLYSNTLVSAKPDGSDFQIHCKLPVSDTVALSLPGLVLHQNRMYLVLTERSTRAESDEYKTLLYRVHLDRAEKLEHLCSLRRKGTGNGCFEGPYFYYTVLEDRASLLETVADRVPEGKFAQVLFRYRLPD